MNNIINTKIYTFIAEALNAGNTKEECIEYLHHEFDMNKVQAAYAIDQILSNGFKEENQHKQKDKL